MCKVLVIDNDRIERYVTKEVLNKNFDLIDQVLEANNNEEAFQFLDEERIDLMISNMPYSVVHLMKLVSFAKTKNPKIKVILTTTRSEQEAAHATSKLKANGYLLKPYNPELLLSLLKPYLLDSKNTSPPDQTSRCLESLKELRIGLREHVYKKCIIIAKKYLNEIYETSINNMEICDLLVEYTEGILTIAEEYNISNVDILKAKSKQVKAKFDKYVQRYNAYLLVSEMVNYIFDELELDYIYTDDLTKVINYIDRNLKNSITLDQAADYINMNSCYFSKLFKKVTNENFITYITDQKIELAKEMLRYTHMPVVNVAYELSYNETNYFSKAFKKKVGLTPTEYRDSIT